MRRPGRPRVGTVRLGVTVSRRDAETLDAVRDRVGLRSRTAAVRHLIRRETERLAAALRMAFDSPDSPTT